MGTNQEREWESKFGKEYTDRNIFTSVELDKEYTEWYGVTRTAMNEEFLGGKDLEGKKFLEVGSNVGNQLRLLEDMGFKNLCGLELQEYAVKIAKELSSTIEFVNNTGAKMPFEDGTFDLVFTSGVLIHISPENIGAVLDEIYRCSKEYIWGFEYYAAEYTEINYRGNNELLWKTNFAQLYLDRYPDLELVHEKKYNYLADDNVDSMYLLRKKK